MPKTLTPWTEFNDREMFTSDKEPAHFTKIRVYYPVDGMTHYADFICDGKNYKQKLKDDAVWHLLDNKHYATKEVRQTIIELVKQLPMIHYTEYSNEFRDGQEIPVETFVEKIIGRADHNQELLQAFEVAGLDGIRNASNMIWKKLHTAKVSSPQYYHLRDSKKWEDEKTESSMLDAILSWTEYMMLIL